MATINPYPLSPFFSFRWVNENPVINGRYNTLPIDSLQDENNYADPWQCGGEMYDPIARTDRNFVADKGQIQYLSAFVPTCGIYTCHDVFVSAVTMIPINPPILNTDLVCYNGEVDFSTLQPGRYYLKMTWDSNQPGEINSSLIELLEPFIDGNLITKVNGAIVSSLNSAGTFTGNESAGKTYSFEAQSLEVSTAPNPRIRLTVTKVINGVSTIIHDKSEVANGANSIVKTGIIQPGAVYTAVVATENTATVVTPIDIADNAPVSPNIQDWRTSPLDVEIGHPGTLLYEVTNTVNDKGVIFVKSDGSLLVVNCRVHGMLRSPTPLTDSEDYEDQYDNLEQLDSIPSENWTNLIGNSHANVTNYFQLPWWKIQKFNLLYSLNKVLIDGQPFAKISGAEFKPFRVDNQLNEDAYWSIDIQPNSAYPSEQYQTGDTPEGDYVLIYKARNFDNVSANFSMSGVFNDKTNLIKIILYNKGLHAFVLKIGTTDGGSEIKTVNIPGILKNPILIEYPFNIPSVLFLSGLSGTSCDITVVWDDFLAPNVTPPAPVTRFAKNTLYWFVENVPDSFEQEFDITTGLGIVGSEHEGCVLAGTNDTLSIEELIVRGWDRTMPLLRETSIGADSVILTPDNIPQLETEPDFQNGASSGGIPVFKSGTSDSARSVLVNQKDVPADPTIVTNPSIYLPAFYYIG